MARSLHDLGLLSYRKTILREPRNSLRALTIQEKAIPEVLELALTLHNLGGGQGCGGKTAKPNKLYQRDGDCVKKYRALTIPASPLPSNRMRPFCEDPVRDAAQAMEERAKSIRAKLATATITGKGSAGILPALSGMLPDSL